MNHSVKIITVNGVKGGVGTSTVCALVAIQYASQGVSVCIMERHDLSHTLSILGMDHGNQSAYLNACGGSVRLIRRLCEVQPSETVVIVDGMTVDALLDQHSDSGVSSLTRVLGEDDDIKYFMPEGRNDGDTAVRSVDLLSVTVMRNDYISARCAQSLDLKRNVDLVVLNHNDTRFLSDIDTIRSIGIERNGLVILSDTPATARSIDAGMLTHAFGRGTSIDTFCSEFVVAADMVV